MKTIVTLLVLSIGLSLNAQRITYKDLVSIDWNDHPFSIAELLIEKGYKFGEKQTIQGDLLEFGEQSRESHYQLSYTNVSELNIKAAYVCVDELDKNNISDRFPVLKLRYMQRSKAAYEELSNEIKEACGSPDMGFYFAPDSLTFFLDKELINGEPSYCILIDLMSKESFEEMKKKVNEAIEELMKE